MLLKEFTNMKVTCIKLLFCDLILSIGVLVAYDALEYGYTIPKVAYLLLVIGVVASLLIIGLFVKRLCVSSIDVTIPLCISLLPSLLTLLIPEIHLLPGFALGMLLLIILWSHKKLQALPDELSHMDMQLRDTHPQIFDNGIARVSEKKFLIEVNNVLESIPKERFTEKLLNAISDWYAVYVGFCLALQGIFWGIATTILLSF